MSGLLQKLRAQAGFTMIELLVVIAVIGVLSVAVLSSINPIEQINKGRDTRSRSDAAQLISAVDRYFAIHEEYPWNSVSAGQDGTFSDGWTWDPETNPIGDLTDYRNAFEFYEPDAADNSEWAWMTPIVNTAEIKESFGNRLANIEDNTDFYVYKPSGPNRTMYTCFEPSSFSFDLEASQRCNPDHSNYDSQLAETDVPKACDDHDNDSVACYADTNDTDKCWVCLP